MTDARVRYPFEPEVNQSMMLDSGIGRLSEAPKGRTPVVLTLIATYLPGFKSGGPIRSVSSLVEAMGNEVEFKLVTRDRDAGDEQPYRGIVPDSWTRVGNAQVLYASRQSLDFLSLRRAIQQVEHDILYLNSFFSVDFAIKPLVLRRLGAINRKPIVLAPRGQFADSALALKSVKKRLFLSLGKLLGLYEGVIWQATSLHEVEDIRRIIGQNSTVMFAGVPRVDGDETAPEIVRPPKSPGTLSIALLGRIARMKNIRFALECVSRLEGKVQFDIFGPMEDERYWAECEPLVHAMPHNVTVRLQGAIPYEEVGSKLRGYHLFFLPTLGENFGHAVVDALIAGCPVLISDRTPWRDLLSRGCGWDIPLETPDAFCEILTKFVAMDEPELATLSENARRFGLEQSLRGDVLRDNWNLIRSAMDAARP